MSEGRLSVAITPARVLALVRIALVLSILVSEGAERPIYLREDAYDVLIVAAAVWAAMLGMAALSGRRSAITVAEGLVDLALLGGLTFATGGAFSEVRQAFFVVPVIAAATQTPRMSLAWSLAAPLAFTAAALAEDVGDLPGARASILTTDIYLGAIGAASILISVLLAERRAEALALSDRGRALARQLLEVRDTERRELAQGLHDHPVQLLGAARTEFGAARSGNLEALDRLGERIELAEASLRRTSFELHPYALEELGLCEAVREVAVRACSRGKVELRFRCAALSATPSDAQILAIASELISNAARHSGGSVVEVTISATADGIVLQVSDDGDGIDPERRQRALRDGHMGLVVVRERAASIGASISISTDGQGTHAVMTTR